MSGVLRLGNTGAGTGRSTLEASASSDQTFTLPDAGGTLLTSNYSDAGGTITLDGADIVITNANVNINSGHLVIDESTGAVSLSGALSVSGNITLDESRLIFTSVSSSQEPSIFYDLTETDIPSSDYQRALIFRNPQQTSVGSFLFQGRQGGVTQNVLRIERDGDVFVQGNIENGPGAGDLSSTTDSSSRVNQSGAFIANRIDNGTSEVFQGRFQGTETSRINADGTAEFQSIEFTGSNGVLNDYRQGSWLGTQIYLENPLDDTDTFLINAASYNAQGYYVKVGGICHVSYRIQSALNSNISNLSSTTYDSWLVRFALPFNMSYLGTDNQGLTRKIITGTGRMGSATEVFHGQTEFGNDYAEYFGYSEWGDVRAYLAANPQSNYQWYLNLSYPA